MTYYISNNVYYMMENGAKAMISNNAFLTFTRATAKVVAFHVKNN